MKLHQYLIKVNQNNSYHNLLQNHFILLIFFPNPKFIFQLNVLIIDLACFSILLTEIFIFISQIVNILMINSLSQQNQKSFVEIPINLQFSFYLLIKLYDLFLIQHQLLLLGLENQFYVKMVNSLALTKDYQFSFIYFYKRYLNHSYSD